MRHEHRSRVGSWVLHRACLLLVAIAITSDCTSGSDARHATRVIADEKPTLVGPSAHWATKRRAFTGPRGPWASVVDWITDCEFRMVRGTSRKVRSTHTIS